MTARPPSDDSYVLVVHYYQPHVVGFDIDVSVTSLSHSYTGQLPLVFCDFNSSLCNRVAFVMLCSLFFIFCFFACLQWIELAI